MDTWRVALCISWVFLVFGGPLVSAHLACKWARRGWGNGRAPVILSTLLSIAVGSCAGALLWALDLMLLEFRDYHRVAWLSGINAIVYSAVLAGILGLICSAVGGRKRARRVGS